MKIQHKIKCYVFLIALSFLCVSKVYASLEITEIMYDPEGTDTNREWVKLYNNGEENINIIGGQTKSAWRISGGEIKESLHYINEDLNIPAGLYAVITKNKDIFKQEYPSFSGSITTASISFNNTAGIVKIWDGNDPRNLIASKEYSASEDVPIIDNTDTTDSTTIEDNTVTTTQSSGGSSSKNDEPKIIITKAEIIGKNIAIAGLALPLDSLVTNNRGITFAVGRFVWNFGDGTKIENTSNQKLTHIYWYPGDYVLTLSFYKGHNIEPDGVDRMIVKVIPSGVYVSSVGGVDDPYIELENKSSYEIDLSNWIIQSPMKTFIIPEGMILLPNKKIKLSSRITGFNIGDIGFLNIINSNGETMATYPNKIIYNSKSSSSSSSSSNIKSPSASSNNIDNSNINEESNIINLNDLEASAVKSSMNLNINYYLVALFFVIGAGIASVLLLRKKNDIDHDNDGVEGPLTANDIRIIE